jgi:ribonuclease HI
MSKAQKYYVVWQGHHPGIYDSWAKCQSQVKNFPNARYQAFSSSAEAEAAFKTGPVARNSSSMKKTQSPVLSGDYQPESISVDAACSGNPGILEYRGVWTNDKTEIFHVGPLRQGTNNIGEFLAIVHALAWLKKKNDAKTPVYSDSQTAISWVKNKKANTRLKSDKSNAHLFDLIRRAEIWLKTNDWKNPLLKWETSDWGEIAADFGRK